jgi:formate-dependent nitrite reductase membrane component NrfD
MKHKHEAWGWMLAVDFFFAGMGGGMLFITGMAELFFGNGMTSLLGNFIGPVCMGIGSGFLILELGRPFQSWRVFMNPKAILTVGAWTMSVAMAAGIAYASFGIDLFPWSGWTWARKFLAAISAVTGLVVATYPGILLGRHKARPFWNGPGMMSLFMLSSLVTGVAAHILSGFVVAAPMPDGLKGFSGLAAGLLGFQLLLWFGYIWVKASGTTESEAAAAQRWINGDLSGTFKGGFLLVGTLLPLILLLLPAGIYQGTGAIFVLVGGLIMRMLVVRSGEDRTWLPGEQKYRSRLPIGDEEFLKAWSGK